MREGTLPSGSRNRPITRQRSSNRHANGRSGRHAGVRPGEPPIEPATVAHRTRVRDVMTPATFSVRPEATLPELARFMLHAGIHRALVLEGEALTGIVTTFDVLRAVSGELRGAAR